MSSVFLSNVDDYLAPSQACVNPLFADGVNSKQEESKKHKQSSDDDEANTSVVVPRKRRVRRKRGNTNGTAVIPTKPEPKEKAQVSMADCLACSGCVTTAETVLVEQHSLKTLRNKLAQAPPETKICFTISPATLADLSRHLELDASTILEFQQRLATFLHTSCRACLVLNGQVPLSWSLQEAAREFCEVYRQEQSNNDNEDNMDWTSLTSLAPCPSIAVSALEYQVLNPGASAPETIHANTGGNHVASLPVLSSSCPALVCLVEKSHPTAVPHLQSTKSPMAMAGAFLKHAAAGSNILHVAVMPCHDKKLEASRHDLAWPGSGSMELEPDVDLVITTQELLVLLEEMSKSQDVSKIRQYLASLPAASVSSSLLQTENNQDPVVVITTDNSQGVNGHTDSTDFYALGSGGYADYIFRYACRELFGHVIQHVPWKAVATMQRKKSSARVASRKSDYHQVALFRHVNGSYSCDKLDDSCTPVLRFATAYGLQTLQQTLQRFGEKQQNGEHDYDYVEAMACPSGCLNGGGQIRVATRETPTETRQRVSQTQKVMKGLMSTANGKTNTDVYASLCPSGPLGTEAQKFLHTRYHVVPQLQHSMGAAAGVAIQDTQW